MVFLLWRNEDDYINNILTDNILYIIIYNQKWE
jgi:hypothetical protein